MKRRIFIKTTLGGIAAVSIAPSVIGSPKQEDKVISETIGIEEGQHFEHFEHFEHIEYKYATFLGSFTDLPELKRVHPSPRAGCYGIAENNWNCYVFDGQEFVRLEADMDFTEANSHLKTT